MIGVVLYCFDSFALLACVVIVLLSLEYSDSINPRRKNKIVHNAMTMSGRSIIVYVLLMEGRSEEHMIAAWTRTFRKRQYLDWC